MRLLRYSALLMFMTFSLGAQTRFNGILINSRDSSAIAYAVIKLVEINGTVLADENGAFSFPVGADVKHLTFNVSIQGYKATIQYERKLTNVERVYVNVAAHDLKEAEIIGESAREIVRKAVKAIPDNYADGSYFSYSFYRQYQLVNNCFMNLIEATPVVMFKLKKTGRSITASPAYAIRHLRRTAYYTDITNKHKDNISFLMDENPVYNLAGSAIALNRLLMYNFNFDTSEKFEDYVIDYVCPTTSVENYGFAGDIESTFRGSSYEFGRLVIDRKSLAIKKVLRNAKRNPNYVFPFFGGLNYTNDGKNTFEFSAGELSAEYEELNGKWYTKRLCRKYETVFYNRQGDTKEFDITDVFEWQADSASRYVSGDLVKEFYPRLRQYGTYNYDKEYWDNNNVPFYFYNKETVFKDLLKWGEPERQFVEQGKKEVTW